MDIMTICVLLAMVGADIFLIVRDSKHKLTYKGSGQLKIVVPIMIVVFIGLSISSKNFKPTDLALLATMIPLAFCGNKCGINEEGILAASYLTTWDKVEQFEVEKTDKKYVLQYKSNVGYRRIYFSKEIGEKVDEYLKTNRKVRHRRKK